MRRLALVPALAMLVLGLGAASASAMAKTPAQRLVPSGGAMLGAYVDDTGKWIDDATAEAGVTRFEAQLGRTLDIDQHYYAWTDRFPTGLESWDLASGRIPLISWSGTRLADILSGRFDGMIRERAREVRALAAPVFLRWGWEMNGNWSSHDGSHNGADTSNGPRAYVAAWRRIHDLFAAAGATNAAWVWSPNAGDVPAASWNHWTHYYPGDAYVDWVGIDGYNWGTTQPWSSWSSFASLVRPIYSDYAGKKPIMIAETASAERGGDKAGWLDAVRASMKVQFPAVGALVYFETNKETDWSVRSSPLALRAFRALAADPYFAPRAARLLSTAAQPVPNPEPAVSGPAFGIQ
jgi:glycosyl hydrolase family 26